MLSGGGEGNCQDRHGNRGNSCESYLAFRVTPNAFSSLFVFMIRGHQHPGDCRVFWCILNFSILHLQDLNGEILVEVDAHVTVIERNLVSRLFSMRERERTTFLS